MIDNSVSAVLFCFNEEKYISRALDSLLNQSTPIQQVIVADDYSEDRTAEIIAQYTKLDPRVKYVKNAYSKGKVHAYQTALEAVTTQYFFVIGSDDEADKNLISSSLKLLNSINLPFFYHSAILIDQNSQPLGGRFTSKFNENLCFFYNQSGGFIFANSAVIKKIIPFPDTLEFEDWYCILTLYETYGAIHTCKTPFIRYRIHGRSTSQSSRFDWERRKKLLLRDIRFLELMNKNLVLDKHKTFIFNSINFRRNLLQGKPTFTLNFKTALMFIKTYISFLLARIVSCFQ